MDNIQSLELYTISGVKQQISKVFRVEKPVFVASDAIWRADSLRTPDRKSEYVLTSLQLKSTSLADGGEHYPTKSLARNGFIGRNAVQGAGGSIVQNLVPTKFEIECRFLTDDFNQVLDISSRWMFAAVRNRLNFSISYLGAKIDIACSLSRSLTTPEKEVIGAVPNEFELIGTIIITGYSSNNDKEDRYAIPDLIKIDSSIDTVPREEL